MFKVPKADGYVGRVAANDSFASLSSREGVEQGMSDIYSAVVAKSKQFRAQARSET